MQPFDERESKAWGAITDMMRAFQEIDERGHLAWNNDEYAIAIHTLQDFVKQHMCHRHWPDEFSDWWGPGGKER